MGEMLQTNVSLNVNAVLITINTVARTLATIQLTQPTMPPEMVKSSIAMTGAALKMPHIVEENVFQMLLVCLLDMVVHQEVMALKCVVKDKIAVMKDKLTSNTSLPLILSAVF